MWSPCLMCRSCNSNSVAMILVAPPAESSAGLEKVDSQSTLLKERNDSTSRDNPEGQRESSVHVLGRIKALQSGATLEMGCVSFFIRGRPVEIGSRMMKVVPLSISVSKVSEPPCLLTITACVMANPWPVPWADGFGSEKWIEDFRAWRHLD